MEDGSHMPSTAVSTNDMQDEDDEPEDRDGDRAQDGDSPTLCLQDGEVDAER